MIGLPRSISIFACRTPIDMRKQFDSLAAVVIEAMRRDPHDGALYLFVGRDRRRAKVLFFDGTGVCVFSKRLEKGRFASLWSGEPHAPLTLTSSELSLFLEGSDVVGKITLSPPALERSSDLRAHASRFTMP